jgi:redox-sensitive bicupin YhaK (pirin superfamily)
MSAGSGISHSEYNASHYDAVNFLQIWIFPKHPGIKPRQDQRTFYPEGRKDQWQVIVSPRAEDHALWINQDARLALCHLSAGKQLTYTPAFPGNGVYIFLLEGSVEADGHQLQPRDGIGITDTQNLTLTTNETSAELLAIEVPMFA